jgi:hypothetical protein
MVRIGRPQRRESGNARRTTSGAGLLALAAVVTLTLAACGGGGETSTPVASDTAADTPAPITDPNAVQRSLIGMHIEGVEGGAWASAPFGALRLWDNGTGWSQIETAKGTFNWKNLDDALANAESKGMTEILYVLGTTPEWAATEVNDEDYPQPGAASPPKNIEDWKNWVTEVTTKYGDRINAYQIWNEANLKNFFNGSPAQMAELTKTAYDIIKTNDPDALVVSASPSTRLAASFDKFMPEYLTELKALNWPVDVFAIHTYPDGTGDPAARGLLVQKAKDALTAAGAPALPLWDTELNYGLAGPGDIPKQEITGARAAGFIVRTYIDDLRLGIDRSYWYIWTLAPYDLLGVQAYVGSDGEQGFFALDNWVIGSTFGGCLESNNAVTCDFSRDGVSWVVAWAQTGEAPYAVPENAQLVCDPLANCVEAEPGGSLTLTEVPVRVYLQ